jgi:hypothetical protein
MLYTILWRAGRRSRTRVAPAVPATPTRAAAGVPARAVPPDRTAPPVRGAAGGKGGNNLRTYGAGKRGPNDTVTKSHVVRSRCGCPRAMQVEASGAPPARARASWVAPTLPGALPLRYRLVTDLICRSNVGRYQGFISARQSAARLSRLVNVIDQP